MNQITVFLASSVQEFKKERNALRAFCADLSDVLDDYGYDIKMFACEEYDKSIQDKRTQEKYNEFIKMPCDIFFNLYGTKAGMYTIEEMEVAMNTYHQFHKPYIYIGFSSSIEDNLDDALNEVYRLAKESPIVHEFEYQKEAPSNIISLKLALLNAIKEVNKEIKIETRGNEIFIFNQRILILPK